MKRHIPAGVSAFLVLLLTSASWAQQAPQREFGLLLGAGFPSRELTGLPQTVERESLVLGLRAAMELKTNLQLFGDLTGARYNEGADKSLDTNEYALRVGPEFLFGRRAQFFVAPALGWAYFDPNQGDSFNRGIASVGIGQRFFTRGSDSFRWEVRGERVMGGGGSQPKDFTNAALLLGYSFGGTPRDSDGDGVSDKRDKCPETPVGAIVDPDGCPRDSDGDGVWDGIDRCPNTPRGATVDASGCPKDSDGDGVWDGIDRCPNTPRGATVDASGCPKDSDGDGVWDGIDRCPDTPRGAKVNATGCTEVAQVPALFEPGKKTLVLEGVNFESDSAVLLPSSLVVLDRVAASLKAWPDVQVEVGGHTDSTNTTAHNQKLSGRRADSVRNYLIGQGVAASRLVAKGYGEGSPISDNKTKEGRKLNRRVELRKLN